MLRLESRLASPRARRATLLLVLAVALGLRLVFWAQVSRTEDFGRLAVDAHGYDEQARGVLAGTWPGDAVFYQDALYPYFLAAHYRTLGDAPQDVFRTQTVLGLLTVALVLLLAREVLGPLEGLLAGLLAATYAVFPFYETLLLKAALSLAVLTGFLLLLVLAGRRARLPLALAAGLAFGATCLLRGNLLALLPIALVWLLASPPAATRARRAGLAVVFLAGAAAAIAPVTLHNLRAGEPVLITSQAGQNFYIGNNPHNATGSYVPPPGVRGIQTFEQVDFARLAEEDAGRPLSVRERSRYWFGRALAWMRAHPADALALTWRKLVLFLNRVEVPDNADFGATREQVGVLRLPLPGFGLVLLLAAAAAALVRWTRELVLLAAVGATVAITVVAFYVFSRYRLPVVPVLLVFAAALPRALAGAVRERRIGRIAVAAVLAGLAGFVATREAWTGSRSMLHYNRALFALEDGDRALVRQHLERALEEDPANGYALVLRGQLAAEDGDLEAAVGDLGTAARLAPHSAEPRYKLGLVLEEAGELRRAADAFRDALGAEPRYDVAAVRLAATLVRLDEREEARGILESLVERRPRWVPALHALGRLLLDRGELPRARELLERALAERPGDAVLARDLVRCRRLQGEG